jgi:hypothetical protein
VFERSLDKEFATLVSPPYFLPPSTSTSIRARGLDPSLAELIPHYRLLPSVPRQSSLQASTPTSFRGHCRLLCFLTPSRKSRKTSLQSSHGWTPRASSHSILLPRDHPVLFPTNHLQLHLCSDPLSPKGVWLESAANREEKRTGNEEKAQPSNSGYLSALTTWTLDQLLDVIVWSSSLLTTLLPRNGMQIGPVSNFTINTHAQIPLPILLYTLCLYYHSRLP